MLPDSVKILFDSSEEANLQLPDPTLVQYYKDLANRIIWVDHEIDSSMFDVFSSILNWNQEDKDVPIEERRPIRIFFNSPGGSLDVEETLVSIIKLSKTPIHGIAIGMVASAASLIYLSCPKRFALPNAYFIFHRGSCQNIEGNYNEVQAAMQDYKEQVEKMENFYINNTSYPEEVIREKIKSDWYIHMDEALKYNIVTDLVEDIDAML